MRDLSKDFEMNSSKMDSIFLQYSKNALDFQLPNVATMSGCVPHNRSSVAPQIWKECPDSSASAAPTQTSLH